MPVRGDLSFQFALSPRVIKVTAPSTELTIQDLVDTAREAEDELLNLDDRKLLDASGKEDLGGGTSVGVTAKLLDTVVAFEARKTWVAAGTVTTPDATGRTLTDGAGNFASVLPGAWVVNMTDRSICSVVRVVSSTAILTDVLGGGTDNRWDAADVYRVLNVVECEVRGGNLVAVDKFGAEVRAVLGTAGTTVVVARSSSATLTEQLSAADVADAVWDEVAAAHVVAGSFGALESAAPTAAEVADAVWDEPAAAHVAAGSFGELQAAMAALSAQQIALVRECHQLFSLDATYVVEHGQAYIRVPADGSLINIKVTKSGTTATFQRL